MKIALAQLNYHIGNFEGNINKIKQAIDRAREAGAKMVVFSELSVCGYPPHDLLERKDFIEKCNHAVDEITSYCKGITAIIGSPTINKNPKGKKLHNSAIVIKDGEKLAVVNKTLLPTYDIFDEDRYFEPNTTFQSAKIDDASIAITICEDVWEDQPHENVFNKNQLYLEYPLEKLKNNPADFIINIAASPFAYNRTLVRKNIFTSAAKKYNKPVIFVNQAGAHTELIFDGGSMVVNSKGSIIKKLSDFSEDFVIFDTSEFSTALSIEQEDTEKTTLAKIHDALVLGIRDYFKKLNFKKAVLGLSGGIDSAVTLVLAERALGKENMAVLLLPSKYSSGHSVTDALQLANNLGVEQHTVSIERIVQQFDEALKPIFKDLPPDIAEENIQARIRGNLLMAFSNKFGHILLNTSNKSEAAVGYGTLYGDMSGGISVLGDVYKSDVFKLARYINTEKEIIPNNIIIKPPSAELRPDQKDTDSLPEYDILDKILYQYIEQQKPAKDIIAQGLDPDLTHKIIRMVDVNEYKRYQTPPILRISSKAFGPGRRLPLVAKY